MLAGEDSWTTLFQTFNTIYGGGGTDPLDLSSSHGRAEEGDVHDAAESCPPAPMTPSIRDLLPRVLHVNQGLLGEVAMRPPSPGTYSTFADGAPSHISVLLLAARALYSYPALQRLFPKHAAIPYVACVAGGGLHSPECLHALMALREATSGALRPLLGTLTDAELAGNRKHAFDAGLTRALQELVEAATQLVVTHPPKGGTESTLPQAPTAARPPLAPTVQVAASEAEQQTPPPSAPASGEQQPGQEEEAAVARSEQEGEEAAPAATPASAEPAALEEEGQQAPPATSSPLPTTAPDPLEAAVPTLRLLLDLLCAFLNARQGCTPPQEYDALRRLLLQHSVLLFELSRHPVRLFCGCIVFCIAVADAGLTNVVDSQPTQKQDIFLRHRAMVLLKALILDSSPMRAMALQHAAVSYGVLLWQVTNAARSILVVPLLFI